MQVETKQIKLSEIRPNPDNPRQITEKQLEKLIKSLREFPEMRQIREIVVDDEMMILGGNMRYRCMQRMGEKVVEVKIVTGLTDEQKREFIIKDNAAFGSWDFDILANEWDDLPLIEWGLDLPGGWFSGSFDVIDSDVVSDVAPRKFNDDRDEISMFDLLNSVDLVKISFSGGKDSVATVLYVHNHYKVPKNKILLEHYYNPFEWSDIGEYCKYFTETFGGCFGVELKTYGEDGAKEFMIEKIKEKGLPSVINKWCFEKYKQRVFGKVAREYKKLGINYIQAVGIRAAESPRRSKMLTRGIIRDVQPYCYPIFDLSDEEVFQMPIQYNIKLHHAYRYFSRTGCPFCPMCPAKEFLILKREYPEVWERALELFLYSLECDFYRKMDNNRAKEDLGRIMGIGAEKSRKADWVPPVGLEFWGC